jgi:hypothetical protein
MRTDELRTLLHDRGDEVQDLGAHARVGAVHERVRTARRRRAAGAAGGLVAAVAAVALAVVPGSGGRPAPAPADVPAPKTVEGYTKDGVTYPREVRGERLLGASIGDPGQSEVSFEATAPGPVSTIQISPVCYGRAAEDHAVSVSINGTFLYGMSCDADRPANPAAEGTSSDGEIAEALGGLHLQPGEPMKVRVWLGPRTMNAEDVASHPEMVVGAGIYEDTRPESKVGGVNVPELMEFDSRTWEMASTYEADPGSRRIVVEPEIDRGDPALMVAAVSGLESGARYRLSVDGHLVGGAEAAVGADGPSWQTAGVIDEVGRHKVEIRVVHGDAKRARLSIIHYQLAD